LLKVVKEDIGIELLCLGIKKVGTQKLKREQIQRGDAETLRWRARENKATI
jgi:hypothetical protein